MLKKDYVFKKNKHEILNPVVSASMPPEIDVSFPLVIFSFSD
jgi:hypothetical protein